jgi:hypothetical protein
VDIRNRRQRTTALFALAVLPIAPVVVGQTAQSGKASQQEIRGLPSGAVLLEVQVVPMSAHAHRLLALWMQIPQKHPRDLEGEAYTCPERTRGNYYSGPTRISLVNALCGEIINTVRVTVRSVTHSGDSGEERE